MNVLLIDWPCFGKTDAVSALEQLGYHITYFSHKDYQEPISADFEQAFTKLVSRKHFRFCFSFNFFPVVAESCKKCNVPYVSIIYDNPYVFLYSYTIIYKTNYVFLFDKQEYLKLKNYGIETVHYIVLPANGTKINQLKKKSHDKTRFQSEISFVGSLYNESHNLIEYLSDVNEYTKGFLDAVIEAQLRIYGYNFLEDVLSDKKILDELLRVSPYHNERYGIETPEYIYANYYLCRKITSLERQRMLTAIAEAFPNRLKLFTLNKSFIIPHAQNMGTADYYSEMPYIFSYSKINLNITLKSIQSGIPLRAMDIMGAGGFLLTNYQADFFDYFVPDEDFVYYTDKEDLLSKIEYYLSHDQERKAIAKSGQQKVLNNHSFQKCFQKILAVVFP